MITEPQSVVLPATLIPPYGALKRFELLMFDSESSVLPVTPQGNLDVPFGFEPKPVTLKT